MNETTKGTKVFKMEHPEYGQRCMIFTERASRWQFADFFSRHIGMDDASYFSLYGHGNEIVPFDDVIAWLPEPGPPSFAPVGRVTAIGDGGDMTVSIDKW